MANSRIFIQFLIASTLVSPFLLIIGFVDSWQMPSWAEAGPVLGFTVTQALFSAGGSVILGVVGALGLLAVKSKPLRTFFELIFILPNIVPTLFVLVGALNVANWMGLSLFGFKGIVLVHLALNTGLVAVAISRIIEGKLGGMLELAWIEGAGGLQFLKTGVLSYLRRDLGLLFLFVFSICFTSFAVPLILGGVRGTTLEVLIYNKMGLSGELGQALVLSGWQTFILLIMGFGLSKQPTIKVGRPARTDLLRFAPGLLVPLVFSGVVAGGQALGTFSGSATNWSWILNLWPQALGTLAVAMGSGLLVVVLLMGVTFALPHQRFQSFLIGYAAPSAAITGFGLWLVGSDSEATALVLIAVGIGLTTVPGVYRFVMDGTLSNLAGQVRVARTLGASWSQVFLEVTLPQAVKPISVAAALTAFWACGDFALSSIIAPAEITLALKTKSLLSAYRVEAAAQVVWIIAALGGVCWLAFIGLGRALAGVRD